MYAAAHNCPSTRTCGSCLRLFWRLLVRTRPLRLWLVGGGLLHLGCRVRQTRRRVAVAMCQLRCTISVSGCTHHPPSSIAFGCIVAIVVIVAVCYRLLGRRGRRLMAPASREWVGTMPASQHVREAFNNHAFSADRCLSALRGQRS